MGRGMGVDVMLDTSMLQVRDGFRVMLYDAIQPEEPPTKDYETGDGGMGERLDCYASRRVRKWC